MATGIALAVPGPPPPDGDLQLDHRLQPVDVGSLEQADLDQSHGPGRIATRRPRRLAPDDDRDAGDDRRPRARGAASRRSPPTCRPISRTSNGSSTSTAGSYTPEGVNEVGRWTAAFLTGLGARVDVRPDPDGRFGDTIVATFQGMAGGPRVLLIGHMDTVFDPGTAAERPFRIDDGMAHGPGRHRHEVGAARRAVRAQGDHRRARRPAVRAADVFIANPDEEVGSPTLERPHPGGGRGRRCVPGPRVCPRQRRHRVGSQGHPRHRASPSTAGPPMPGSSRRRGAARSSRRPASCATCTPSTGAGRAYRQRREDRRRHAARTSSPSGASSRSTSGPRPGPACARSRPRSAGSSPRPRSRTRRSTPT